MFLGFLQWSVVIFTNIIFIIFLMLQFGWHDYHVFTTLVRNGTQAAHSLPSGAEASRKSSWRIKFSEPWCVCEHRRVCVKRGNLVMSFADSNLLSACPLLTLPACSCFLMRLLCQLSLQKHAHVKSSTDVLSHRRRKQADEHLNILCLKLRLCKLLVFCWQTSAHKSVEDRQTNQ